MKTETIGGRFPLIENTEVTFIIIIKAKAKVIPAAKCIPVPPLVFLDESETPIRVKIM